MFYSQDVTLKKYSKIRNSSVSNLFGKDLQIIYTIFYISMNALNTVLKNKISSKKINDWMLYSQHVI